MPGWSVRIGKVMGVEVRLHSFLLAVLVLCAAWASVLGRPVMRGMAVWGMLLLALGVREVARCVGAAWYGAEVRSVLLLPTGGLLLFGGPETGSRLGEAGAQRVMGAVGVLASALAGLGVAGVVFAVAPGVRLTGLPLVSPLHLVETLLWVNMLLAAVNVVPAWPLDMGRLVRGEMLRVGEGKRTAGLQALLRVGPMMALAMVAAGVALRSWWMCVAGLSVLMGMQVERQGTLMTSTVGDVKVREVMLEEYTVLGASTTLEDAVERARHSMQDVFPVVRGGQMVGATSRQEIVAALEAHGNGYVQGMMARSFEVAKAEDGVMTALGRVTGRAGVSGNLVPVVDGDRVVGILTPEHLRRSMGMLARRRIRQGSREEDETT